MNDNLQSLKTEVPKQGTTCRSSEGTENSMSYLIESSRFLGGKASRTLITYKYRVLFLYRNPQSDE